MSEYIMCKYVSFDDMLKDVHFYTSYNQCFSNLKETLETDNFLKENNFNNTYKEDVFFLKWIIDE